MKKMLVSILLGMALLSMSGCVNRYRIEYDENVVDCPSRAKAGETVRFETVFVCDADLYVYVNGTEIKPVQEGIYEFVMPAEDVQISTKIVANGLA